MGKKQGEAQRTKGNIKPSSSGKAAELLQQVSVNLTTLDLGDGSFSLNLLEDTFDSNINVDFRMSLRKLCKKDSITKLKGLEEIKSLIETKTQEEVQLIVPFWCKQYTKLSLDSDRKIRELCQQTHEKLCLKVHKSIAPHLKTIMPYWILAQSDVYESASTKAQLSFKNVFSPQKQPEVINYAKQEIFKEIYEYLINETIESITDQKNPDDEALFKYETIICMCLNGLDHLVSSLSQDNVKELNDKFEKLFSEQKFWDYGRDKSSRIRCSYYQLLGHLVEQLPDDVASTYHTKMISKIFYACDEHDYSCSTQVWFFIKKILTTKENCWNAISAKQAFLPKIYSILKKNNELMNLEAIYSTMLPLVTHIPDNLIDKDKSLLKDLFKKFKEGLNETKVKFTTQNACRNIETQFSCAKHLINKYQNEDDEFVGYLTENVVLYLIEDLFKITQTSSNFAKLYSNKLQSEIESFLNDISADTNETSAKFWSNLNGLFMGHLIQHQEETVDVFISIFKSFSDRKNDKFNKLLMNIINEMLRDILTSAKALMKLSIYFTNEYLVKVLLDTISASSLREFVNKAIKSSENDAQKFNILSLAISINGFLKTKFDENIFQESLNFIQYFELLLSSSLRNDDKFNQYFIQIILNSQNIQSILQDSIHDDTLSNVATLNFIVDMFEYLNKFKLLNESYLSLLNGLISKIMFYLTKEVVDGESSYPLINLVLKQIDMNVKINFDEDLLKFLIHIASNVEEISIRDKAVELIDVKFFDNEGFKQDLADFIKNLYYNVNNFDKFLDLVFSLVEKSSNIQRLFEVLLSFIDNRVIATEIYFNTQNNGYIFALLYTSQSNSYLKNGKKLIGESFGNPSDLTSLIRAVKYQLKLFDVLKQKEIDSYKLLKFDELDNIFYFLLCSFYLIRLDVQLKKDIESLLTDFELLENFTKNDVSTFLTNEKDNEYFDDLLTAFQLNANLFNFKFLNEFKDKLIQNDSYNIDLNTCYEKLVSILDLSIESHFEELSYQINIFTENLKKILIKEPQKIDDKGIVANNLLEKLIQKQVLKLFDSKLPQDWLKVCLQDKINGFLKLFFYKFNTFLATYLLEENRDTLLLYVTQTSQNYSKNLSLFSTSQHFSILITNYYDLLSMLSIYINNFGCQNEQLKVEWEQFFTKEIFDGLFVAYTSLCSKLIDTNIDLNELQLKALSKICETIEKIPLDRLKNNNLEIFLNVLDYSTLHKYPRIDTKIQTIINTHLPNLNHRLASIQTSSYLILKKLMSEICDLYYKYDENAKKPVLESSSDEQNEEIQIFQLLPKTITQAYFDAKERFSTLKTKFPFEFNLFDIELDTNCLMSYLYINKLILDMFSSTNLEFKVKLVNDLRENNFYDSLMNFLFRVMPSNPLNLFEISEINELLNDNPSFSQQSVEKFACYFYKYCLCTTPALIRDWLNNQKKSISDYVDKYTTKWISPMLIANEIKYINDNQNIIDTKTLKNDYDEEYESTMKIKANLTTREITATYKVKELTMELVLQLPHNYPLGSIQVKCSQQRSVSENQWRNWLLQLTTYLMHQNGDIIESLRIWKRNVDKNFNGVEECTICYSVINGTNYQLPKMKCRTCKKKFHSVCLYKWFESSSKSTCPLCRNLF